MEAPAEEQEIPSASQFLAAFYPAVAVGVFCLTAFPLIRSHFPDVYDPKRERVRMGGSKHQRGDVSGMPPELPKFTLDWLKLLWTFTDTEIVDYCGADALMFQRFLRLGFKASVVMMVYALCVLVPINAQGTNNLHGFDRLSASNVQPRSNLFWAHFTGSYLFSLGLLYLLYTEFQKYVELRQDYLKSGAVQNYSIVIRDIPKDVDRATVERYLTGLLGNESVAIHLVGDAKPYDKLIAEKDDVLFKLESARAKYEQNPGARPTHKLGFLGLWGEQVDSLEHWEGELKQVNQKIAELREQERGFAHAAIVTFETIRVATAFQNIPLQQQVRFMKVTAAPARNDVLWDNLGEPSVMRWFRGLVSAGVVFFIIFCYTIPVGFIASLANLEELSQVKGLTWLKPVAEFNPSFIAFLQGFVPPLVLSVFFALVPTFMVLLSRFECLPSESDAQTSAIWKVFLFVLFDSFLVYTFAGSVLSKLNDLKGYAQQPGKIIDLLSQSLPKQAAFFMNLIMLAALSVWPLELLRVGPLVLTKLKRRFLASSMWDHLATMRDDVAFHELYAFPLLVFLIMCAYATLSPFVLVFTATYFAVAYVVNLNQLLYVYNVPYHTGGKQYPVVFRCCIVSIIMFQALVTGVLGLNRLPTASALMFPLMAFTAYWGNELSRQFRFVGNTLTLENLLSTDLKELVPDTMEALKKAYQLHLDDGTGAELSHKAKQPLIEPFAVTRDGQLLDIGQDDEMELGEANVSSAVEAGSEETKAEHGEEATKGAVGGLDAKTNGGVPVAATAGSKGGKV